MAIALFILGHAASGKTTVATSWIRYKMEKGEHWCLMDKDDCGDILAPKLMQALGLDPNDRDSYEYKSYVRDLEYKACLNIAKEQLKLGINIVLPGPWTKELNNEDLFNNERLMFPKDTQLCHVYLNVSEAILKKRIIERKNIRDEWKLNNWSIFSKTLTINPVLEKRNVKIFSYEEKNEENQVFDYKNLM